MAPPNDAKARITSHMNKEHSSELKQYLQAFNGLSSSQASNAQLIDLSLDSLTIKSASGTHNVRVSPAMGSLADARVRLVDMASAAQAKLGLSDVRVTRFEGPRGAGIVSFVGVAFYFACAIALSLDKIVPGTPVWDLLDRGFPYNGAEGFVWTVRTILVPVVGIHASEAYWMARSRLAKHGIEFGSLLWIAWVAETFLEGYPAMMRFDAIVAEAKAAKDGVKH